VKRSTISERALILAPRGRDAAIAKAMLEEAQIEALVCPTLSTVMDALDRGAGFAIVTEEAIAPG